MRNNRGVSGLQLRNRMMNNGPSIQPKKIAVTTQKLDTEKDVKPIVVQPDWKHPRVTEIQDD